MDFQKEIVVYFFIFLDFVVLRLLLFVLLNTESKENNIQTLLAIFMSLLMTAVVLFVNIEWIYIIYLFILGPRIASENYLILLIKAWKTSRKEERYEDSKEKISSLKIENKSV